MLLHYIKGSVILNLQTKSQKSLPSRLNSIAINVWIIIFADECCKLFPANTGPFYPCRKNIEKNKIACLATTLIDGCERVC